MRAETDGLEALAQRYPDRAVYIHVEIWRNYQKSVVNAAATDWVCCDATGSLTEPWLFLIGTDGSSRIGGVRCSIPIRSERPGELPARSPESTRRPGYHRHVPMSPDVPTATTITSPTNIDMSTSARPTRRCSPPRRALRATWVSLALLAVTALAQLVGRAHHGLRRPAGRHDP